MFNILRSYSTVTGACLAFLVLSLSSVFGLFGQNLHFTDTALKSFLLQEMSLDLDSNGLADAFLDANSDGEIQQSEALQAKRLVIITGQNYPILHVGDLQAFTQLKSLHLQRNGLIDFVGLQLLNLQEVYLSDMNLMDRVDLSGCPNLHTIVLESLSHLKHLNLKNGSFANQSFSLFYTNVVESACVDSIQAEYDAVAQCFLNGNSPSYTCSMGQNTTEQGLENQNPVIAFPNPCSNFLNLQAMEKPVSIRLFNLQGQELYSSSQTNSVPMAKYPPGLYRLLIQSSNQSHCISIVKE